MIFQGVISQLLHVMQKCLENGDEDVVAEGLDLIQECAAMEQPLVNDHIQNIVPFTVQIIGNFSLESSTRNAAGQTILSIIELRPKLLAKQNLIQPILEVFVQAIANSDSSGCGTLYSIGDRKFEEEDDDDEEYTPATEVTEIAQMCLDRMALSMTSKSFAGPALSVVSDVSHPSPFVLVLTVVLLSAWDHLKRISAKLAVLFLELFARDAVTRFVSLFLKSSLVSWKLWEILSTMFVRVLASP
jgi:hypothetical protein